jgi:hypothetical protein
MIIAVSMATSENVQARSWALGTGATQRSMTRGKQQTDWLVSSVCRTILWLSVMLMLGGIQASGAKPADHRSSGEFSIVQVSGHGDSAWAEACVALAADDQEDVTEARQDLVETGDGVDLTQTIRLGGSSHRLALGLLRHQAFADRPEVGTRHARAPPAVVLVA